MHVLTHDYTGKRFGRLVALVHTHMEEKGGKKRTAWICKCDCGGTKIVRAEHLKNGKITSCGCYMVECIKERNTTHGNTKNENQTSEYRAWRAMKQRCNSKSYHARHRYSERGITICDRWLISFELFLEDMGKKPTPKHTLERIENDKGYYKENCTWKLIEEQQKNKSSNRYIEHLGRNMILSDWAKFFGVNSSTLSEHLDTKPFSVVYDFYSNKKELPIL